MVDVDCALRSLVLRLADHYFTGAKSRRHTKVDLLGLGGGYKKEKGEQGKRIG